MTESTRGPQKCPSCGAQAANLKNCEYCGSFLVQFAVAGIAGKTEEISSSDAFIFDGLLNALKFNIRMQAVYPDALPITDIIYSEISQSETYSPGNVVMQVTDNEWHADKDSHVGISIDVPLEAGNTTSEKFIDSAFFPLFKTKRESGFVEDSSTFSERFFDRMGLEEIADAQYEARVNSATSTSVCYLDFGTDVEGAARLISKMLIEVYGYNETTVFKYGTWDAGKGFFPDNGMRREVQETKETGIDLQTIGKWIGGLTLAYFLFQLFF